MATYEDTQERYNAYSDAHEKESLYLVTQFKRYIASGNNVFLQERLNKDNMFVLSELEVDNWNKLAIQQVIAVNMTKDPNSFYGKHYSTAKTKEIAVIPESILLPFAHRVAEGEEVNFVDGLINAQNIPYELKEKIILNNVHKYLGRVDETIFSTRTLKKIADTYSKRFESYRTHRPTMVQNPELSDRQFSHMLNFILDKDGYVENFPVPEAKWHILEKAMLAKKLTLNTALKSCEPSERIIKKYRSVCLEYGIDHHAFVDYYREQAINYQHPDKEDHVKKFMRKLINNIRTEEEFLDTYLLLQNWEENVPGLKVTPFKAELLGLIGNKDDCPSKIVALHGYRASAKGLKILSKDENFQATYVFSAIKQLFPYYDSQKRKEFIQSYAHLAAEFGALPVLWTIDVLALKANMEFQQIVETYSFSDEDLEKYSVLENGELVITKV
jgi:hypothetical protein